MSGDYLVDMQADQPVRGRPKRIVFYGQGLKIYGLLPHLLARRLHAEFRSNHARLHGFPFSGSSIIAPTGEANYTVVPYSQTETARQALLDWLNADGFVWGIAADWDDNILGPNMFQERAQVWHPAPIGTGVAGFAAALAGPPDRALLGRLLPPPATQVIKEEA